MQNQHNDKYEMLILEEKLNSYIGFGYWKRYIAAAFWSNIATPINLAITVLTGLTTGQANSNGFITNNAAKGISIATLSLTIVNTFFRPHHQMTECNKMVSKWLELGSKFELIYYSDPDNIESRLKAYQELMKEVNEFRNSISPDMQNYVTDLIHLFARYTFLRKKEKWLYLDNEFINQKNKNVHASVPSEV